MKKWIIMVGILLIMVWVNKKPQLIDDIKIPDEAIRLRVVANSDNKSDQNTKLKVSIKVQDRLYNLLKDTQNIKEARQKIEANLDLIDEDIANTLKQNQADYPYRLDYGYHYFPEKTYQGVTYEEGSYESLYITLGKGDGQNWWCVLFPPLCIMEASSNDTDQIEYHSFVKDMIDKYFH